MQVLNIFHVLIAISMIAFILIQKGAGATAGAAFGVALQALFSDPVVLAIFCRVPPGCWQRCFA